MKKVLLTLLLAGGFWQAQAQQDAQFTHYMFNTLAVNPAYAGSRDALTVTGLHRSQWVGFDGAPQTQTITLHTPLLSNKLGVGLSVLNDEIGPTKTTSIYADFAYKIQVGREGTLAFGLKGGINSRSNDLAALSTNQAGDAAFGSDISSELLPNFGFGLYYSTERFYAGLSTPRLLENDFDENQVSGTTEVASDQRHFFLIAGSVFDIDKRNDIKLKPTGLLRVTKGAPIDLDLTATFLFHDKFWIGPAFRLGDGFAALVGYNFTNQLSAGYSFDWSVTNSTAEYNNGSHEILLRYDFIYDDKRKIKSPRYF